MSISVIVIGLVVIFIIGNLMGLKPKPHETRLGDLRLSARKMGLHPKFTTPTWLDDKGVIQYTLINDDWRLALVEFVAKDSVWQTHTPNATHPLSGQHIALPAHLLPHIKGMMLKANSISLYWQDEHYIKGFGVHDDVKALIDKDLQALCDYLNDVALLK